MNSPGHLRVPVVAAPPDEPHDADPVPQLIGAGGHRVSPGRLEDHLLGSGQQAMVTAMRGPTCEFRGRDAVRAWPEEVAEALVGVLTVPQPSRG